MRTSDHAVTLSSGEIEKLSAELHNLRHSVNNSLSLVIAVTELLRRKPQMAAQLADSLAELPEKVGREIKAFSDQLERMLEIED